MGFGVLGDWSLNLERVQLVPPIGADDDSLAHPLRGDVDPTTGLLADRAASVRHQYGHGTSDPDR